MVKNPDKVKQGRRNRANGASFELRVRKELEEKGWLVDKFSNNIEINRVQDIVDANNQFLTEECAKLGFKHHPIHYSGDELVGKIIPAKRKYAGPGRPMAIGTGFPDFVCIKIHDLSDPQTYQVQFVECKTNGKLDKIEKQKCAWLQEQGYNILIASKTKVKNRIVIKYENFFEKYGI